MSLSGLQSIFFETHSKTIVLLLAAFIIADALLRPLAGTVLPSLPAVPLAVKALFLLVLGSSLFIARLRPPVALIAAVLVCWRVVNLVSGTAPSGTLSLLTPVLLLLPLLLLRAYLALTLVALTLVVAGRIVWGQSVVFPLLPVMTLSLIVGFGFFGVLLVVYERSALKIRAVNQATDDSEARVRRLSDQQKQILAITLHEIKTPVATISMLVRELEARAGSPWLEFVREQSYRTLDVIDHMGALLGTTLSADQFGAARNFSVPDAIEASFAELQAKLGAHAPALVLRGQFDPASRHLGRPRLIQFLLLKTLVILSGNANTDRIEVTLGQSSLPAGLARFHVSLRGILTRDEHTASPSDRRRDEAQSQARTNTLRLYLGLLEDLVALLPSGQLKTVRHALGGETIELSFALQLEQRELDQTPLVTVPADILRGLVILVVEDTPTLRRLAIRLLEKEGATCLAATGGDEAMALIEQQPVDVVLTDLMMPDIDGFMLTRQLRQRDFPGVIVGLTAAAGSDELAQLSDAGANGSLAKPLDVSALKVLVHEQQRLSSEHGATSEGSTGEGTGP